MSIVSDALKKVADRRRDVAGLRTKEELARDLSTDIKRLAAKKTRWSVLSTIGTFFIVGTAVVVFLYNRDYLPSFMYLKPPVAAAPKMIDLEADILKDDVPKKAEEAALPPMILNGVIEGGGKPLAIINNKILGIGDSIYGAQVTHISSENVILDYGGKELRLRLD